MVKFRTRLVLSLLSLISLVLIALGILLGQMFKGYYLQSLNERLEKEAAVMAYELNSKGGIDQLQLSELDAWSERLKITVTIVRMDGAVLYDSGNIDDRSPARHEEIIKNIVSSKNSSVYHENMANKDEVLYRSAELRGNAGEKAGLVILSTETDEFNHIYQQIWNVLLVSLGASLIIIILVGTKITNRYTKPIESATTVAIELAKGNYRARSSADTQDEVGMLNTSINILARNLQDMMHAQENHQDRLTTIIENIGSGLLLIDDRGFIVMVNRSFRELLQTKKLRLLKKRYHE
ncbi:MAG TPA: HAMP domain-containing protein, partial [Chondromyces sp.]|nr:HAMP domain-containing protein [Chondromyces sp.]